MLPALQGRAPPSRPVINSLDKHCCSCVPKSWGCRGREELAALQAGPRSRCPERSHGTAGAPRGHLGGLALRARRSAVRKPQAWCTPSRLPERWGRAPPGAGDQAE